MIASERSVKNIVHTANNTMAIAEP